jgi:hypothetical protein
LSVGGADASQNGFGERTPAILQLKSAIELPPHTSSAG